MSEITAEIMVRLEEAYEDGRAAIAKDTDSAHVPAESFKAITKVEQHRWHWRPDNPRVILIAESHVYTSDSDLSVTIKQSEVGNIMPPGQPLPPSEYVGLVYCLGYGEKNLLVNCHAQFSNRGTLQYWDLLGRIADTGKQPRIGAPTSLRTRLQWKVATLIRLKELGVWLLDASAHAIYIGNRVRRSPACCKTIHRQWWDLYGNPIVKACDDPVVWVIGKSTHSALNGLRDFHSRGFIYQPNARNVDLEYNWDRLLASVAEKNPQLKLYSKI